MASLTSQVRISTVQYERRLLMPAVKTSKGKYFRTNTNWTKDLAVFLKQEAKAYGNDVNEYLRTLVRQTQQAKQSQ